MSLPQYLQVFQINLVNNMFELIAYIINQYVVWPQFSIWRIGDLFSFAIFWLFGRKDKISVQRLLSFYDYNISLTLAYLSHCLVSGILLSIFDPLILPLVLLAIIMHQLLIRYFIIQIYKPGETSEGSPNNDVFLFFPEYLFYSFFASLLLFAVYMFADLQFPIHIITGSLSVVLAFALIFVKKSIDSTFKDA